MTRGGGGFVIPREAEGRGKGISSHRRRKTGAGGVYQTPPSPGALCAGYGSGRG